MNCAVIVRVVCAIVRLQCLRCANKYIIRISRDFSIKIVIFPFPALYYGEKIQINYYSFLDLHYI